MERAVIDSYDIVKRSIKWAIKADQQKAALEKRGARILYQSEITNNGKSSDIIIAAESDQYTVRVNNSIVGRYRTFDFAVRVLEDRGYISHYEAVKLTRGAAAADKERKIQTVRTLLKRR